MITGVCKNMNNRKPNPASKLRSARGRAFSQPIAYIFTLVSIYDLFYGTQQLKYSQGLYRGEINSDVKGSVHVLF